MIGAYGVFVEGLSALTTVDNLPENIITAATRAINATARHARTQGAREIRRQVAFPARYLDPSEGRLAVTRTASKVSLEAAVTGRRRATSLARFAGAGARIGQRGGLTVTVHPGTARIMRGAFLMKLNSGNTGLAVRTRSGQKPSSSWKPIRVGKNLWLLYGPSVDQVFFSARAQKGVAVDIAPDEAEYLEAEFLRLLALETK